MAKSICTLTMALSVSLVSCLNDKSAETKLEIKEFIPAYCSMELRDVLVQNMYVQVLQQRCYPDSYRVQNKDCQGNDCSYLVTKESYTKM